MSDDNDTARIPELEKRAKSDTETFKLLQERIGKLEAEARRYYTGDGSVMDLDPKQVIEMRKDAAKRLVQLENQRAALQLHSQHIENLLEHERSKSSKAADRILALEAELDQRKRAFEVNVHAFTEQRDYIHSLENRLKELEKENAQRQTARKLEQRLKKRARLKARLGRLEDHVYNLERRIEDIENEGQ